MAKRDRIAKVQRFKPYSVDDLVSRERAVLPCGCCIFVGRDVVTERPGVRLQGCSDEHQLVITRANGLLMANTGKRSKGALVDAVARILTDAARQVGI